MCLEKTEKTLSHLDGFLGPHSAHSIHVEGQVLPLRNHATSDVPGGVKVPLTCTRYHAETIVPDQEGKVGQEPWCKDFFGEKPHMSLLINEWKEKGH